MPLSVDFMKALLTLYNPVIRGLALEKGVHMLQIGV
jgi:hypothetical protein